MKVYIVQTCEYDDTSIHGVYATRALAEQRVRELDEASRAKAVRLAERWRDRRGKDAEIAQRVEEWCDHYTIAEYTVTEATP